MQHMWRSSIATSGLLSRNLEAISAFCQLPHSFFLDVGVHHRVGANELLHVRLGVFFWYNKKHSFTG